MEARSSICPQLYVELFRLWHSFEPSGGCGLRREVVAWAAPTSVRAAILKARLFGGALGTGAGTSLMMRHMARGVIALAPAAKRKIAGALLLHASTSSFVAPHSHCRKCIDVGSRMRFSIKPGKGWSGNRGVQPCSAAPVHSATGTGSALMQQRFKGRLWDAGRHADP